MVDGIESIGGYGGGREHPGGGRGAPGPHAPAPKPVPHAAPEAQAPAAFAPIAGLLDDIARLAAEADLVAAGEDADLVAARMLASADATLSAQARLDASCVRALLEPPGGRGEAFLKHDGCRSLSLREPER